MNVIIAKVEVYQVAPKMFLRFSVKIKVNLNASLTVSITLVLKSFFIQICVCTLQIRIGNALYFCSCIRYVTQDPEDSGPLPTSLIIGISVGCGLLLITVIVVVIILVVCCRCRDEPAEAKADKDQDNDSIELEHYDSIYDEISGDEALKTDNDCYTAEDTYYAKIHDDNADNDNEYCRPGAVQPEEFKPYSVLDLPELPERLSSSAEKSPEEPTAGDAGEIESTDESLPYYLTLVDEPSVC